jgi:hypothetical protein
MAKGTAWPNLANVALWHLRFKITSHGRDFWVTFDIADATELQAQNTAFDLGQRMLVLLPTDAAITKATMHRITPDKFSRFVGGVTGPGQYEAVEGGGGLTTCDDPHTALMFRLESSEGAWVSRKFNPLPDEQVNDARIDVEIGSVVGRPAAFPDLPVPGDDWDVTFTAFFQAIVLQTHHIIGKPSPGDVYEYFPWVNCYPLRIGVKAGGRHSSRDPDVLPDSSPPTPPPFSPASVAGLKGWYSNTSPRWQDAARTVPSVADGDPIGAWDDLSGLNNHLLQSTGSQRPTLKLAIQNGLAVARFDGVDDWLHKAAPAGFGSQTGTTVFAVMKRSTTTFYGMIVVTNHGTRELRFTDDGVTPSVVTDNGGGTLDWSAPVATFSILQEVADGSMTIAVDGATPITHSDSTSSGSLLTTTIEFGARNGTNFFQGDIAEVLVYDNPVSSTDRDSIRNYLKSEWGTP